MGCSLKAIDDDMDRYVALCAKYNEPVQYSKDYYGNNLIDCYGKHSKALEERVEKEWRKQK